MPREKITVNIAGIKMNLITSSGDEVSRMASSLDTVVRRRMKKVGDKVEVAMLMLVMEQAETLKKNAALIHSQQEQIFALTTHNAAILGEAAESAPIEETESVILAENMRLIKKNEELADEIDRLKTLLSEKQ